MTVKEVSSVIDDINEWPNPQDGGRLVYFVTAFTTDGDVLSAGRKDMDAALEVQGLLREAIGQELDFQLAGNGVSKAGKPKFKILGFGTPGGPATYTAPGVQGGGAVTGADPGRRIVGRPPEPSSEQASIRASVALKAAVDSVPTHEINLILEYADAFNAWMLEKTYPLRTLTSGPASSAYEVDIPVSTQAGAGSEDPSAVSSSSLSAADSAGPGSSEGEAGDPTPHEHDWQMRQGIRSHLVCDCGATRKKETV